MNEMPPLDLPQTPAAPHAALLLAELAPARKTAVVDVGANPINEAPYAALLRMGGCHVTGFEPQADAFAALQKTITPDETYHPFAVGDGGPTTLNIYRSSGMTSIFQPYLPGLTAIGQRGWGKVLRQVEFDSVALDAIPDLGAMDLLKIDIQGGETLVFQGAETVLAAAVVVIVELRYLRLYEEEPMLGGVDCELRRQGFYLHKFMFNKSKALPNSQSARLNRKKVADQLVDGDGVYVRNIAEPERLSDEQLKHLAILASSVFSSHSLVLSCLDRLVERGVAAADLPARYVDTLPDNLRRN